jgi:hypothetical protein
MFYLPTLPNFFWSEIGNTQFIFFGLSTYCLHGATGVGVGLQEKVPESTI